MTGKRTTTVKSYIAGVLTGLMVATPVTVAAVARDRSPATHDGTSPRLTVRPVEFVVGASIDAAGNDDTTGTCTAATESNRSLPLRLRCSAADAVSGLASQQVWVTNPSYRTNLRTDTTGTAFAFTGDGYYGECSGSSYFQVNDWYWLAVRDNRGNVATSAMAQKHVDVWRETGADKAGFPSLPVKRTGTWSTASSASFNHGHTLFSTRAGASLIYTVKVDRPRTLALVASKGSNRGVMRLSVDGGAATAVNTHATAGKNRVIVWQRALPAGTHTLQVTNAGTPGHSRIDVDSLMLGPAFTEPAPVLPTPNN